MEPVGTPVAAWRCRRKLMLSWALTFFVVALVAALLGFGGVAGMSAQIGWLLAVLGVVLLIVGVFFGRGFGGRPPSTIP
jgi:uncharacterized membrane protein YtjA (UPF0391 family)